jgi:hypothetical protein
MLTLSQQHSDSSSGCPKDKDLADLTLIPPVIPTCCAFWKNTSMLTLGSVFLLPEGASSVFPSRSSTRSLISAQTLADDVITLPRKIAAYKTPDVLLPCGLYLYQLGAGFWDVELGIHHRA